MVMTPHAPPTKTSTPLSKSKGKTAARPFRSVIGRTPKIRITDGIVASAWEDGPASKDSGTVIAAGKFKATCLKLLDRAAQGETIIITKHGKVVGRLMPPEPEKPKEFVPLWGRMRGQVKILGDVVSPDLEAWGMTDPRKKKKK